MAGFGPSSQAIRPDQGHGWRCGRGTCASRTALQPAVLSTVAVHVPRSSPPLPRWQAANGRWVATVMGSSPQAARGWVSRGWAGGCLCCFLVQACSARAAGGSGVSPRGRRRRSRPRSGHPPAESPPWLPAGPLLVLRPGLADTNDNLRLAKWPPTNHGQRPCCD